jgi:hypothetical protein
MILFSLIKELAAQLSDHSNVTLIPARAQLQALSVRSGILMQNLGSLLLELGRNAIMLHMGPTPVCLEHQFIIRFARNSLFRSF